MTTAEIGFDEGASCGRNGCHGHIKTKPSENCSCHISPPCAACTSPRNYCSECDWEEVNEPEEKLEVFNDRMVKAGTWIDMGPRPLDTTKVDWHSRSHSSCSMIKEGVFPEGTSREEVRKLVDGTFGGRFEHFGNGKFKFIAYTD